MEKVQHALSPTHSRRLVVGKLELPFASEALHFSSRPDGARQRPEPKPASGRSESTPRTTIMSMAQSQRQRWLEATWHYWRLELVQVCHIVGSQVATPDVPVTQWPSDPVTQYWPISFFPSALPGVVLQSLTCNLSTMHLFCSTFSFWVRLSRE